MEKTLNLETREYIKAKSYNMATIPPKGFYKLSKQEQESEAIKRMNVHYQAAEEWKKLSIKARSHQIPEPKEVDRPDLAMLKD